jgi:hypothetical protein
MNTATAALNDPITGRLEPLRTFLREAEAAQRERLSAGESDDLEALVEHAWPNAFARQYFLHSAVWFFLGVFVAGYAFNS